MFEFYAHPFGPQPAVAGVLQVPEQFLEVLVGPGGLATASEGLLNFLFGGLAILQKCASKRGMQGEERLQVGSRTLIPVDSRRELPIKIPKS